MNNFKRVLEWTVAVWVVFLALALPLAVSANGAAAVVASQQTTQQVLDGLMAGEDPALSPAEPSTSTTGWLTGTPFDVPAGTLVVNTPGTDDTTMYRRIDPMRGDLSTVIVVSPQSFFPIISGNSGHLLPIFAPTYDQSVATAVAHNLATMEGLKDASDKPYVVYSGYSQGADAVGEAAEQAYAGGLLDPTSTQIVLVSDPRSPWGVMQWATDHCLVRIVSSLIGARPDGARNPANTGDDLQVTSVIVDGDPAANFQWVWYRPITSLIVDAAGFLAVHALMGPQNYSNLDQIQDKDVLYSRDGRTTYIVYHAEHPLTQLTEMVIGLVGIHLSKTQVEQLDAFNNWFYPLQQPSVERAAPAAPVTTTPPTSARTGDETSTIPTVATLAVSEGVAPLSLPQQSSREAAAPETTTPSTPADTDDETPTTPAVTADPAEPEGVDTPSDEPPSELADTSDSPSAPEITQPSDDEGTAPDSDLPENDSVARQVQSTSDDESAEAGDSDPGPTDVKQGGNQVDQPSQESSAGHPESAAA